jgi:excisionase family DNA binding protein
MTAAQYPAQGATKSQPEHRAAGTRIPDLLTPGEVAELFGVDPKTVTKWATAGKLSCIRTVGGHRRYKTAEVCALLVPAGPPGPPSERPTVNCPVPGLGPLESAIMTVIWDAAQPLTVRAVRDRLGYRKVDGETPAYTTVMTVMNILWRKELLTRAKNLQDGDPRAWWYEPRITRDDQLAAVIRHALDCTFDPMALLRRAVAASDAHR